MSVLGDALGFLTDFGLFDVILPFLLVFAVVFGILEKTRILVLKKLEILNIPEKILMLLLLLFWDYWLLQQQKLLEL